MRATPAKPEELGALIALLDDETPEVRAGVAARLRDFGGDLSEQLAAEAWRLGARQLKLLSEHLRPARREALCREWVTPSGGAGALRDDWEGFEALLRLLSDFLHDGVTLRQGLSDSLDLLAEEAEAESVADARMLAAFLFGEGRLRGNREGYYDPRNSDLAWVLAEGRSNPIGLCLIYILVGRRLGLEVEGVLFPGHFLCRIHEDGHAVVIDCYDGGRPHLQEVLLERGSELDRAGRHALRRSADPGAILVRVLNNLVAALEQDGRPEDARLIDELRGTL